MDSTILDSAGDLDAALRLWDVDEYALIEKKDPQGDGGMFQRERIAAGAAWACSKFSGDLVEIGCLNGSTTVRLAEVARATGRRVIAIDPWEIGTQNCNGGEFEIFTETIKPYAEVVDVLRYRSDDPVVLGVLDHRELAFAFVDGLHTYEAALGDLRAVRHAGLLALDDVRWNQELQLALELWGLEVEQNKRKFLQRPYWRESWIV